MTSTTGEDWQLAFSLECPWCGHYVLTKPWWDDAPENGGACIGDLYQCGNEECDWGDSA